MAGIAAAAKAVERNPTEAQKKAGNYAKGHLTFRGLPIALENVKGGIRSGVDRGGKRWSVRMPAHYGYIKRTDGADGDHVDVYLGPDAKSDKVFVVDQIDAETGKFDEHKVMLAFPDRKTALDAYKAAFSDGKGSRRMGGVAEMGVDAFKAWLASGKTRKPMSGDVQRFASGGTVGSGFIHSDVAGRTDRLPVVATADSFVIPSDVVSGLGQGNSLAGAKILDQVLGPQRKMSSGGEVPIIVAGGEYRVEPESVKRLGGGDMERGHAMLRKMVLRVRKGTIKQLKSLPNPKK